MANSGRYVMQPSGYKAFIPEPLPRLEMSAKAQDLLGEAESLLPKLDAIATSLPNHALFLSMYVRKEALLSSQIEGTQATLEDVLVYESYREINSFDDVAQVVNYIRALNHGIARLEEIPLGVRLIKELHQVLMTGVRGHEKTPGEFRRSQNWIGPAGGGLKHARFVPPPPDDARAAMAALEKEMHRDDLHPLVQCALVHYQFETIHPFLDGNGRIGRLLIALLLHDKGLISRPLLYISTFLKMHRQEYYDRLTLVRERGDYLQWVEMFLEAVVWTAGSAIETVRSVLALKEKVSQELLRDSSTSKSSLQLLDHLFDHPITTIKEVAKGVGLSLQGAANQVALLQDKGIVAEITTKKRNRRFAFSEFLSLFDDL